MIEPRSQRRPIWKRPVAYIPITLLAGLSLGLILDEDGATSDTTQPIAVATSAGSTTTTSPGPPATTTTSPTQSSSVVVSPPPPEAETAKVVSITDGDTIRVDYPGGSNEPVRLIGINAAENGECFSSEATAALQSVIGGETVTMVPDQSDRDQFDRLLRYIYLPDGTFINHWMVRNGYALAREYPPDTSQAQLLAEAQAAAESDEIGMWASDACGTPATASLEVIHVEYDAPGNDHENLNGEWVDITNRDTFGTSMQGWVLKDESASHRYSFPSGYTLSAGQTVTVFTGCGADTTTDLYWCNGGAVWNNSGDTAFLLDPTGNIHDQYPY